MSESIHFEPEVIDDIYYRLGINKPKETFQQIVEQNLIKEAYKMGYAEAAQKNQVEQMTKITSTMPIDDDYVLINGIKYKKVETPEPKTLKELFEIYVSCGFWNTIPKEIVAQELVNILREFIPEPMMCDDEDYDSGYNEAIRAGYNEAIREVNKRLFNDNL